MSDGIYDMLPGDYVKVRGGQKHKIAKIWGVYEKGRLYKPSEGGFGVTTESGLRVSMWDVKSYHINPEVLRPAPLTPQQEEYRQAFKRLFENQDWETTFCHFDGHTGRSTFLRDGWNFAIDRGWLRAVPVSLEQDFFYKGYLTELGKIEIFKR